MTIAPSRSTESFDDGPDDGSDDAAAGTVWWRNAVIYEIYPRSFSDADGDGTGDLAGVRSRLPYLKDLGVDAIWFTPWYSSPLADGGYDVADYRMIDPAFGTLADAEQLIAAAAELGIRTIIDVVPNHVSDRHAWFTAALAAGPGSPERERFWFRAGGGDHGETMPTNWRSSFSGTTWTRVTEPNGRPGDWYLHLFSAEQPDLNWEHPDVRREHEDVLRFWFDRGVAGIRIDSAAFLTKDPSLPEVPETHAPGGHPHMDRDDLHDIYRAWRRIADSYDEPRILVGEVWLPDDDRFAAFLRGDEMHTAFNFEFMATPWDPAAMRRSIEKTLDVHAAIGAPPTWVLSNHDVTRPVTRYGRDDSAFAFEAKRFGVPTDLERGAARARAAAMLIAALPGTLYIYQGDELGLPEVETLPIASLQDPMHFRSGGVDPGRDGCRVPLPWRGEAPSFGFGPDGSGAGWLPQPDGWGDYSVEAQLADVDSTLRLYRRMLDLRRSESALHSVASGAVEWLELGSDSIVFARGDAVCAVAFGDTALTLPAEWTVILSSTSLASGPSGHRLPADSAAWLRRPSTR